MCALHEPLAFEAAEREPDRYADTDHQENCAAHDQER